MPINYGNQVYWEKRYKESPGQRFDWVTSYEVLKPVINQLAQKDFKILYAGCGNSTLGESMHDDGYSDILSIDFSREVIQQTTKRNHESDGKRKLRPQLKFRVMDASKMSEIEDNSFDMVIDKCMLDAVLCGEDSTRQALRVLRQVNRVLKVGGTYLMLSHAAPKNRIFFLRNRLVKMEVKYFKLQHMEAWLRGEQQKQEKSVMSKGTSNFEKKLSHFCFICTKQPSSEGQSIPKKKVKDKAPKQIKEQEKQEQEEMKQEEDRQDKEDKEEKVEEAQQEKGVQEEDEYAPQEDYGDNRDQEEVQKVEDQEGQADPPEMDEAD